LQEGVDLTAGTLTYWQGKTKKLVLVPLAEQLRAHLHKLAADDKPEVYVCPRMATVRSGGRHGLSQGFKRIIVKAGIDLRTVQGEGRHTIARHSFHSLRHSFTSALANAGVAPELRMKLTGHASAEIHRGYTHHEVEILRGAIRQLPKLGEKLPDIAI
jgi:integrase